MSEVAGSSTRTTLFGHSGKTEVPCMLLQVICGQDAREGCCILDMVSSRGTYMRVKCLVIGGNGKLRVRSKRDRKPACLTVIIHVTNQIFGLERLVRQPVRCIWYNCMYSLALTKARYPRTTPGRMARALPGSWMDEAQGKPR